MDALFVKLSAAAKANDISQIMALSTQLGSSSTSITSLKAPDTAAMASSILTSDQKNKLETLPTKVKTEADSLSKTVFSFSY
jgi:hypothetical protein